MKLKSKAAAGAFLIIALSPVGFHFCPLRQPREQKNPTAMTATNDSKRSQETISNAI